MHNSKRKCEKGFQHTGRSIQAVCLESNCTQDRLLCFYCIHESHSNHSIAYLIPGLKSPLQMLNKNSQIQHPQKHMKFIQKRFKKINNAWLRISDNLENGITRIQQKMIPQFNVIRETFKKNSVEQIIRELTSNQISSQRIQEYVNMINMVKKYKFNDIKKLKIMSKIIEHKLSKVFLNANNRIKSIMQTVISQTDQMNFINFNVEQVLNDRNLYLQISNSLKFYKIQELQINSQTIQSFRQKHINNEQNYILIENEPGLENKKHQENNIQVQQNGNKQIKQIGQNNNGQNSYQNRIIEQDQQKQKKQQQQQKEQNQVQQKSHYIEIIEQNIREQQDDIVQLQPQSEDQQYSNGFRSWNKKLQEHFLNSSQSQKERKKQYVQQNNAHQQDLQIQLQQGQIIQISSDQHEQPRIDINHNQQQNNASHQNIQHSEEQQVQNRQIQQQIIIEDNYDNQSKNEQKINYFEEQKNMRNDFEIQHHNDHNDDRHQQQLNQFSCQFPSVYASQVNQNQITQEIQSQGQDIIPSFQFNIIINRNEANQSSTQKQLDKDSPKTNTSWLNEKVNPDNKFDEIFGLTQNQLNQRKNRQFQLLKKYFIFAKDSDQQSSEESFSIHPKSKKILQNQLKHQNYVKQYEEPELRKKVKKNEQKTADNKNFENNNEEDQNINKQQQKLNNSLNIKHEKESPKVLLLNNVQKQVQQLNWKKQSLIEQISQDQPLQAQSNIFNSNKDYQPNQKQNFSFKQNRIQNIQGQQPSFPFSSKLDDYGLAEVSSQLLKKCQNKMIKKQKNNKTVEQKIKISTVQLIGRFHEQIRKKLSLIDQTHIQELSIYCDTMECALDQESIALICKMVNLKKLRVNWAYRLSRILVKKLIHSLSELTQLVLCQFYDVDTQLANQIVVKLPKLRRFHYASDYIRNLDKMEENVQFFIDFMSSSTKLAPLYTLSNLKDLETFWISDVDNLKETKQMIGKMKNLKQISICAFEKKHKDLNVIFTVLSKKNTLISLSLQCLQFKQQCLVNIIRNNPNLNTLVINQCPTVSNNTIAAVADTCPNLEQLYLMLTDSIGGQRIFELKKLKTLVIRACWSINVQKMKQGLKKLQNLTCLSLNMNNYWLNDDMLPSIASLQNLRILNLDTTKVSDKGIQILANLKNLTTLICGRTQISANGLFELFQNTKSKIKKLGLSRESNQELRRPEKLNKHDVIYPQFSGKYLVKIGQLLPQLTHLSIGGFKNVYIEDFATLDNLKCLQYKSNGLSQQTEKFLVTTNLNMNANF